MYVYWLILFMYILRLSCTYPIRHDDSQDVIEFLEEAIYDECDGKDANNYTQITTFDQDHFCKSSASIVTSSLIAVFANTKQQLVNDLRVLSMSFYDHGEYKQVETLYLVTSGNLQGKFVYRKGLWLTDEHLKKCSSILGYTYVTTKNLLMAISDKLDLNIFITQSAAWDAFVKTSTTLCNGKAYVL